MHPELMFNECSVLGQLHAKSENGFIVLRFGGGGMWVCGLYTCTCSPRVCVSDRCLQEFVVFQASVSINVFLLRERKHRFPAQTDIVSSHAAARHEASPILSTPTSTPVRSFKTIITF